MFTGIIEEIGRVVAIRSGPMGGTLTVAGSTVMQGTRLGDSIAVNGVCLTVTDFVGLGFSADVMKETLDRSNLGKLRPGSRVNLERAMAAGGRYGGHMVSGHIDGIGKILRIHREGNARWFQIKPPVAMMKYMAEKGSVAIDGISLTIARSDRDSFWVSIIPTTLKDTVLGERKPGDMVNLESDPLARYQDQWNRNLEGKSKGNEEPINKSSGISRGFLESHGFGGR